MITGQKGNDTASWGNDAVKSLAGETFTSKDTATLQDDLAEAAESYAHTLFNLLVWGTIELHELPEYLSVFYYLGEQHGRLSREPEIALLESEANHLYQLAFNERIPLKHGANFAELCRRRGDFELAQRVEADMKSLRFQRGATNDGIN